MRTLLVLAALAAMALCQSVPSYCTNYGSSWYGLPQRNVVYPMYYNTDVDLCFKFDADPGSKSYDYVALRRRTRFNASGSYLYFCVSDVLSNVQSCSFSIDSSYVWYSTIQTTLYGHVKLYLSVLETGNNYVYFDMRQYNANSHTDWKDYCSDGNCASEGACLYNGSCWCDEGHEGCNLAGLAEWIIYLIVVFCIIIVLLPVIIIICCCCCVGCCAAAAAAAH